MNISRRQLFTSAGLVGAGLGLGSFGLRFGLNLFGSSNSEEINSKIFMGHHSPPNYSDQKSYLSITELKNGAYQRIPLNVQPHGILKHPHHANSVVCIQKFGSQSCEVNWNNDLPTKYISASANREFYGHGAFAKNNSVLLTTEVDTTSGRGALTVRDSNSYQILGEIETYGVGPHDCRLLEDKNTLVIANSGNYVLPAYLGQKATDPRATKIIEKSCLTWVDLSSGKLLEKRELPNLDICAGHFEIDKEYTVAITMPQPTIKKNISQRHQDCIYISTNSGPLVSASQIFRDAGIIGELLSISIHPTTATALVTNPQGKQISFWDLKSKTMKKYFHLDSAPTGTCISKNKMYFMVSNQRGEITYFDAMSLEPTKNYITAGIGSHMYILD